MLSQHFGGQLFRLGGGEGRFLVGTIKKLKCHEKTSWTWEIYLFRSRNNIKQPTQGWALMTFEECSATNRGATLFFLIPKINKYPSPEKSEGLCNQPIMNPLAFLNAKKYPSTENPSPRFSDHYMVSETHTIRLFHSHILSRDSKMGP